MNFGTVTQFFGFFGGSEWVSDHCAPGGWGVKIFRPPSAAEKFPPGAGAGEGGVVENFFTRGVVY